MTYEEEFHEEPYFQETKDYKMGTAIVYRENTKPKKIAKPVYGYKFVNTEASKVDNNNQ